MIQSDISETEEGDNMNKQSELNEKSLLVKRPDIAKDWYYTGNKKLRPEDVFVNSHKKVWWKCEKGHKWEATVAARTNNGQGCPVCSNRVIIAGYNDLETLEPEIAKYWNNEKNGDLKPSQVSRGCNKKVWWKCEKGHEYQVRINDKVKKKSGCPICSNRIILPGYNDLKTLRPDIAAEWANDRNELKSTEVGIHSNKKVWWKCSFKRHYWEARVHDRNRGTGCPYCARKRKWKNVKIDDKNRNKA